ncbi:MULTISPECIES: L,D-transpeptidase [unclassified Flavobacterium]|uniref:L,D-transpeptidase n=1 Tax=unclassified Flavobacterium TaxID=196869 RepID=UPI003F8E2D0D
MKKSILIVNMILFLFITSCKNKETDASTDNTIEVPEEKAPERKEPKNVSYHMVNTKEWLKTVKADSLQLRIAYALNRTDAANLKTMDSIVVADDVSGDLEFYMPFPLEVSSLKEVKKIIFFSYPTQTFATYEKGHLIYTGPTNMGRKQDQTPTGLFFTNWKAEETTSTFNDEWDLKWNFNIENKLGVGFHEYSLPGYPASHSCLRLQEKDAKYLYEWADQWELADEETVKVKGTPVIVFGSYDFNAPKPWLKVVKDPKALIISEQEMDKIVQPYMDSILKEQKNRAAFQNKK